MELGYCVRSISLVPATVYKINQNNVYSQLLTVSHSEAFVDALSMFSFLDFFEPNRTKTVGLASMNRGPHLVAIVVRILSELGKIQVLFSTYNQLQLRTMQCIEEG